jgi:maleate cis-trans isomerase
MTTTADLEAPSALDEGLPRPRARIGMIIPAVNRVCEPQFTHYAPPTLGFHFMRARVAGKWSRPIVELSDEITRATQVLAECGPDLMVYNCTASSMQEGPQGERQILDIVRRAAGIDAISTSEVVGEALRALGIKSLVLISPYQNNNDIVRYLQAIGIVVVRDIALALPSIEFGNVTPRRWYEIATENDRPEADGIFLSCAATTQIEAIAPIEKALNKPVVNSNQAVLWGCLKRLKPKLGAVAPMPELGRLMQTI